MRGSLTIRLRLRARILCGLAALALLGSSGGSFGDELAPAPVEKPAAKTAESPGKGEPMTLLACRQYALERSPVMAAARASLAAAQARQQAVNHLGIFSLISRDLPIRREQSELGVAIGAAAVTQAEWDTLHSVTFSYLSVIYARKQLAVANQALERMNLLHDFTDVSIKQGKRADLSKRDLDAINVYRLVGKGRREEAVVGEERALAALREAMGMDADCPLAIQGGTLSTAEPPALEAIVAAAIARRGEMSQATNAAQVTCLEINAQGRRFGLQANTFAAASDVHAREVPLPMHNEVYRPGALGLEMPVMLPGCRGDRVNQAQAYHDRTEAVVEKTHKLIAFEAEQTYRRWQEASRKAPRMLEAATLADTLFGDYDPRTPTTKFSQDEVLRARLTAVNTRLQANEEEYKRVLTIAELERVTAGGFDPAWQQTAAANGEAESQERKKD